jgi:hypothetical protein
MNMEGRRVGSFRINFFYLTTLLDLSIAPNGRIIVTNEDVGMMRYFKVFPNIHQEVLV